MNLDEIEKKIEDREKYYEDHPVQEFFRNLYLFFRYRIYHIFEDIWYSIKWGFQRMFRGYDDQMLWGYPHQNARYTLAILKWLQKNKHGYPIIDEADILPNHDIHPDAQRKWNIALGKMARGFEAFIKEDEVFIRDANGKYDHETSEIERKRLRKIWEEGSAIYIKHYGCLWD